MDTSVHDEDLQVGDVQNPHPCGFDAMEKEEVMGIDEREIWLEREQENLLDVTDPSIFYSDFPPLPDFPCMSSSSSSSSTPAPTKPILSSSSSGSSSSAASWAMLKSDAAEDVEKKIHHHTDHPVETPPPALSSTASMEALQNPDCGIGDDDCMDVMENFGYMDLIDASDIWNPSSIFQSENPQIYHFEQDQKPQQNQQESDQQHVLQNEFVQEERPLDELGVMFFEWLKSNKEHISAEDMRNIKLKRSTVECASKRLGSTKEGKKQLLKLILEWVEQYQLHKKKVGEAAAQFSYQFQDPNPSPNQTQTQNLNLSSNSVPIDPNTCFSPPQWIPPPPAYVTNPAAVMAAPPAFSPVVGGYMVDPYSNVAASVPPLNQNLNFHSYPPPTEYNMLESAQSWPPSQFNVGSQFNSFPENSNLPPSTVYGDQYSYPVYNGNGERLMRLGNSATKEARKKRMARQRRFSWHHHRHHQHQNQHQNQTTDQNARLGGENCTNTGQGNLANWVYWPSGAAPGLSAVPTMMPMDAPQQHRADRQSMQVQNFPRQGWKQEKNLKFLLQKVLKQSDVGNLGRIVLPKKEAETHLPELEARDGIPIAMEDIGTSHVWNLRYRFWPNNKSRMYLLENTGDFVRANGLQEGDFIVIYSDIKCGKYLIRGVKVRQPGTKSEGKKPAKRNVRNSSSAAAGNGSTSSPAKQTVK